MTSERPDFGPSGYLPPRAARRARKIMLREPLGLQWAVAAVVAGLLVLLAGAGYLLWQSRPPGAPFTPAGQLSAVDPRGAAVVGTDDGTDVLVVRGGGRMTVFALPDRPVSWCPASGRLEAPDGAVWEPSGQLVGGTGTSLTRLPAQVHDGIVYVDTSAEGTRLPDRPEVGATPAC